MSKTISVETTINAPLNKVWDEVSQIKNHSNWMKDAVKIDFESELRSGIGTKIKVLTKIGPFKLYDYMTFTKWEENKTIGVDHVGIVTGKGEMQFKKIDEYTTNFKWTETLKISNISRRTNRRSIWRTNSKVNMERKFKKFKKGN